MSSFPLEASIEPFPPKNLFPEVHRAFTNSCHAVNPKQKLCAVTCSCTKPRSDEPCPHKAGLKTSQTLCLIFPGCCQSPGSEEVFLASRQLSPCWEMPPKSERETNTQEMVTDFDALTAEQESHPAKEGRGNSKISVFSPQNEGF